METRFYEESMIQLLISLLVLLFSLSSPAMGENVHFRQSSLAAEGTVVAIRLRLSPWICFVLSEKVLEYSRNI
jgi:hypothetical protein